MTNSSQAKEQLQQAIDAEIFSLEESIRVLRLRRNALSPISSLPPEVVTAIFSHLCPLSPDRNPDHHLARLRISHVCHQWREIALNHAFLWSHLNFTDLSLAGATEVLARAKSVPLYLEARVPDRLLNDVRYTTFRKEVRRASLLYTTSTLAQECSVSIRHLKNWYHLLPLSNLFRFLPVVES